MARLLLGGVVIVIATSTASGAQFVPLGHLPGGNLSAAAGISADGTVVVGYSGD